MPARRTGTSAEFGGPWTLEKLGILERYLDAYTTALKDQPFELWYIDAFAGSGRLDLPGGEEAYRFLLNDRETRDFVEGSAARAIKIQNKPFDKFVFVEKNATQYDRLRKLAESHRDRDIDTKHADANEYLAGFDHDWSDRCGVLRRGVLFLDPYATAVEWATIEKIAGLEALDTWILFPTSALSRMLPKEKKPDDVDLMWAERLTKVYGNERWQNLYRPTPDLFGAELNQRSLGVGGLLSIYKNNLENLFGNRFLQESRPLVNSKNSVLFEFIFCAGHPKGTRIAHRIARHLIKRL